MPDTNENTLAALTAPCQKSLDNSDFLFQLFAESCTDRTETHWSGTFTDIQPRILKLINATSSSYEAAANSSSVLPEGSHEEEELFFSCRQAAQHIQANNQVSVQQLGLPLSHHSLQPVSHCTNYRIPGTTPFPLSSLHILPSICTSVSLFFLSAPNTSQKDNNSNTSSER